MSSSSDQTATRRLTCSICGKLYREPRILACLHTFCTKCIEGLDSYPLPPGLLPSPSSDHASKTSPPPRSHTLDSCSKESSAATSGYESELSPTDSFGSLPLQLQPRRASSQQSDGQVRGRTVVCPTCDSEVDLPEGGVTRLPLDCWTQNNVALALVASQIRSCALCVGEVTALAFCLDCGDELCAFCSEAHKRQRRTGGHKIVPLDQAEASPSAEAREEKCRRSVCRRHPTEELGLFCETCSATMCSECAKEHPHLLSPVSGDVARARIKELAELLERTRPRATEIGEALTFVRATSERVRLRHSEVCREVEAFAEDYVRAVNGHRDDLLCRVRRAGENKQRVLKLQGVQLEQALEDVESSCAFAERLLAEGSDAEVLDLAGHVGRRLQELGLERHQLEPRVDEFIDFIRDSDSNVSGFPVKGTITARRVSPARCSIRGNVLPVARQGNKCSIVLVTRDGEGQQMRRGGAELCVQLFSKNKEKEIPVKVFDRKDGTYALSFQSEELGLFWLHIKITDRHIQGSPFPLPIKPKRLKHYGIFHCCTFCSSGGQKFARCGCGGTIKGGYQGCGHGHEGHPGKRHWSCCGRLEENSECAFIPKLYQVSL